MSKKYVSKDLSEQIHKKAEPFLTWLKDAEEESESEVIFILFFDSLKKASELTFKEDSYYFYSDIQKVRENSKMSERYKVVRSDSSKMSWRAISKAFDFLNNRTRSGGPGGPKVQGGR